MNNVVRYRAMESLCRQSAVFRPLDSWRLLAEAEMWNHKAQQEIASRSMARDGSLQTGVAIEVASREVASRAEASDASRRSAA